ncbi:ABC transporter permease [Rhizobium sp. S-51]|uniref:ABC transporter permease n=1 Tax=Rhizobium terricola TaxID=2728849 RepID=A0A7Y0FWM5_9HYPH|nr:ABC transporter permease [Rhizobium terricola]NML75673.1 ABC transporter permease [Rhizobium terricola]
MRQTLAPFVLTLAVLVVAIAVVLVPVSLSTADPAGVIDTFLFGPFRSFRHTGNIVEMATPAMLCGLAVALMFRAGMFNLGVEGAFFLGGLATVAIVILLPLPGWIMAPVSLIGGTIIGSSACVVPGVLRSRFEVSELVSSLMLNFAVMFIGLYVVNSILRDPAAGAMVSYKIPTEARLPRLVDGTRIHLGTLFAFVACIAGAIYLFRTKVGYESRIVGANPGFAAHLGLPIRSIMLRTQVIGGAIAAFAGGIELLGLYQRFSWQALPGNGWTGVVVAILARDNPLLLIPSALFLSYLQVGGDLVARNHDVPNEVVGVIQALILILVTAAAITRNPRLLALIAGRRQEVRP